MGTSAEELLPRVVLSSDFWCFWGGLGRCVHWIKGGYKTVGTADRAQNQKGQNGANPHQNMIPQQIWWTPQVKCNKSKYPNVLWNHDQWFHGKRSPTNTHMLTVTVKPGPLEWQTIQPQGSHGYPWFNLASIHLTEWPSHLPELSSVPKAQGCHGAYPRDRRRTWMKIIRFLGFRIQPPDGLNSPRHLDDFHAEPWAICWFQMVSRPCT